MKMLILKDSRVTVKAGETVEVSPAQANFLMSTGSAIPAPRKKSGSGIQDPFDNDPRYRIIRNCCYLRTARIYPSDVRISDPVITGEDTETVQYEQDSVQP